MKITKFFMAAVLSSILFVSCSDDDDFTTPDDEVTVDPDPEEDPYENGILVLNEGGTGSVTYISEDLQTVQQEIYQTVNAGDDLGQFAQSIFFNDDLAYIISNGSNLITVVNRYTFELVGKVDSGLAVPYYGAVVNGKAYVTNLADFTTGEDDYVAVIDLETFEVEETVIIGDYSNSIIEENGKLYIENSEYFDSIGSISVFNPSTNQIEDVIDTENSLNSFEIEDGIIYALSADRLEKFNLNTLELESTVMLSYEAGSAAHLDIEDNQVYFTVGNAVYRMALSSEEAPEEALLTYNTTSEWGAMYGFEVEEDRIYIADGGDFESNSFVEIYDVEGNLLENISVGVGPNGFYFND